MKQQSISILQIKHKVEQIPQLKLEQIPQIDLYMDQVMSLFDQYLNLHKRNDKESTLTKTMINNYVKAKILTPVINKKYNRTQIVLLVIIYKLKQILSLEDIKTVLNDFLILLNNDFELHSKLLFEIYNFYIENICIQSVEFNKVNQIITDHIFENDKLQQYSQQTQKLLVILLSVQIATIQKKVVENLIDQSKN